MLICRFKLIYLIQLQEVILYLPSGEKEIYMFYSNKNDEFHFY